ncbi:MAG: copper-binding protein [Sphingomonas sp.]|nr:copper-binding protein [Sphingomonas sp.]
MKRLIITILADVIVSGPAQAVTPMIVSVSMTNFKFTPATVQLLVNAPTTLRFLNDSGAGHNFAAPAFFKTAKIDPASIGLVRNGRVEVPAHSTVSVALTPAAGQFPLKCSHTLHATFGMRGTIVVR